MVLPATDGKSCHPLDTNRDLSLARAPSEEHSTYKRHFPFAESHQRCPIKGCYVYYINLPGPTIPLASKELSPEERRRRCQLVKPATLLAWFRQLGARKYNSSARRTGRPRKTNDIRQLVIEIAKANLGWGYTKIRDALRTGLKVEIGRATVANILAEAGLDPAPEWERKRTWKQFIRTHWDSLYACDFFSVEVLGLRGTVR